MQELKNNAVVFHHENHRWEHEIGYWKKELFGLQQQLNKITNSWADDISKIELEKFQKIFQTHADDFRQLILQIEDHENQLDDHDMKAYTKLSDIAIATHHNLKTRFQELSKEHEDLKKQYQEYLSNNY